MPTVTKFPTTTTTIVAGWNNPTYAYVEDGVNTYSSTDNAEQKYGGWDFTTNDIPEGSTITKVELGAKHYETNPSGYVHYTELKYVTSSGASVTWSLTQRSSLTWDWVDLTTYESGWNLTKLNNADCRIVMNESIAEGGCYVETENEKAYVICRVKGKPQMKSLGEVQVGDEVLICDYDVITEKIPGETPFPKWMKWSKVLQKQVRDLVQEDVVEIWSGELDLGQYLGDKFPKTKGVVWKSHITVTKQQPLRVFHVVEGKSVARLEMTAEQVYNQILNGMAENLALKHMWFGWTAKPFPLKYAAMKTVTGKAYNLKFAEKNAGVFFKSLTRDELEKLASMGLTLDKQAEIGPPFLAISVKTTCYVDAVALRVTYTPPAAGQYYNVGDSLTNKTVSV